MDFPQPKVTPLPSQIDLHGKTALITGASAGIGLETARQMLKLNVSHLILAVRNISKGEYCKQGLQAFNKNATITVLELNMDDYNSVQIFAKTLQLEVPVLNILILNAGIGLLKFERSSSGHERVTQVNYYSNVLLIAELLPYLKASAEKTGHSSRITWVGSRMYFDTTLEKKAPLKASESLLEHMDSKEFFFPNQIYNDSKLLCAMFLYSLAERLDRDKVVLNMVCPGLVNTNMTDVLPFHMRMVMGVVKAFLGRPVEIGGRLFINAAVVAGPESHGRFLGDKDIIEPSPYLLSAAGQAAQKKLWSETIKEMEKLTRMPPEFSVAKAE
ncbi:hypothetical protein PISL3812_01388 [Talaromyces islandicus]|uniref:Uncharacterized protein n=1 Tax=Talaromyces islandicus TaxID=28573 RepID=A0A0U1LMM0_TALIS|nr:hypothetical protein PISL3812_01388 [Talaromyces islandicus]